MDLSFMQGLAGSEEKTTSSDNVVNYVAMRTPEGDITFTYDGDDRLERAFKDYEKLGKITQAQHSTLLNTMNGCEWDLKVDFINGEFIKIEKYTPEEKEIMIAERVANEKKAFFNSEKRIALEIEEDFRLDLGVTETEMVEVKSYIKSIKPNEAVVLNTRAKRSIAPHIQRPAIMFEYDNKEV